MINTTLTYDEMTDLQRRAIVRDALVFSNQPDREGYPGAWTSVQDVQRLRYVVEIRPPKKGETFIAADLRMAVASDGDEHYTRMVVVG